MLRALALLLLLANLAFFVWTEGWLDPYISLRANGDREPERLARQVHPEAVTLLPAGVASAAAPDSAAPVAAPSAAASAAPAPAPQTSCLEAGPFNDAQLAAAQTYLRGAASDGVTSTADTSEPGTWIVYMGRFANREAMTKKEDELKRRKLAFEELTAPADLAPGLSLGRFDSTQTANTSLEALGAQGVHTARVAQLAAPRTTHRLRVERADDDLAGRLRALQAKELGKGFYACADLAGH